MAYCTNCGKKVTVLKRIPLAYVAAGAAALVSALIGPKDMPLMDRIFLALPKGLGQDPPRPVNVQVNIDTEAGAVWYCSTKCRDNDLRKCYHCKRYFSLKKSGIVKDDSTSFICCPSCLQKAEEAEQAYQELVTTMRSDGEELTLSGYAKSGIPFEEKCLCLLQGMGFTASSTTSTNDGGIDIIAIHSQPILAGKYIIQCKDWKSKVGVAFVRELYGVVSAENANKGILITSSTFTKGAEEFAQGKPLELIDGEQLERLIKEYLGNDTTS